MGFIQKFFYHVANLLFLLFFIFIFIGVLSFNTTFVFALTVILGCLDFWFIKNIAGRKLTGLRWWVLTNVDGSDEWKFEKDDKSNYNKVDVAIFWSVLWTGLLAWAVLFILEIVLLNWDWAVVAAFMCVLGGLNTYGFAKCSKGKRVIRTSRASLQKGQRSYNKDVENCRQKRRTDREGDKINYLKESKLPLSE